MPNKKKIRIAIFSPLVSSSGGSFQYARGITMALSKLPKTQFDIQLWRKADAGWDKFVKQANIKDHTIKYGLKKNFFCSSLWYLIKLFILKFKSKYFKIHRQSIPYSLLKFNPNILISPQMAYIYVSGAKHVGVIHDLMHRYERAFPESGSDAEYFSRERSIKEMLSRYDIVLVDSVVGKKHCLESYLKISEEQFRVLPFTAFEEITTHPPSKPSFHLPPKFFFYPAQFWLHKNHKGLAEAIAILHKKYPDIHVVVPGATDKNGYNIFNETIKKLQIEDNFSIPGYLPDEEIIWLFNNAVALVMPTFFGPTNIPPLEAMHLGCPAAVSDIYGMRERCGDAAVYFDPKNPQSIADALEKLWIDEDFRLNLRAKGLERAASYNIKHFDESVRNIIIHLSNTIL